MRGRAVVPLFIALGGTNLSAAEDQKPWFDWDLSGVLIEDGAWLSGIAEENVEAHEWSTRRAMLEGTFQFGDKVELVIEGGYNNQNPFVWRDAYVDLNLPGKFSVKAGLMKPAFGLNW